VFYQFPLHMLPSLTLVNIVLIIIIRFNHIFAINIIIYVLLLSKESNELFVHYFNRITNVAFENVFIYLVILNVHKFLFIFYL